MEPTQHPCDEENTVSDTGTLAHAAFLLAPHKYTWACFGVGSGKSYFLARWMLSRATVPRQWDDKRKEWRRSHGILFANSFDQINQATLPPLLELLEDMNYEFVLDSRPPPDWGDRRRFKVYNNILSIRVSKEKGDVAYIFIRSLDNWKLARGITVGYGGGDEIADARGELEAWDDLCDRLRCPFTPEHNWQFKVVGMPPAGPNWLTDMFLNPRNKETHKVIFMSTTEATHLAPSYVRDRLRNMDPLEALRRIYARIVINQMGQLYYTFDSEKHVKLKYAYDPFKPLYFDWDFNIDSDAPLCATISQDHYDPAIRANVVQVIDEIAMPHGNTEKACMEFLRRYGNHQDEVIVHGDCSGNRATVSEFSIIRDILYPKFTTLLSIRSYASNPLQELRVASVRGLLRNTLGEIRCYIAPHCVELINDFRMIKKGKTTFIDKSDNKRTHMSDGFGYRIVRMYPFKPRSTSQGRPINAHRR